MLVVQQPLDAKSNKKIKAEEKKAKNLQARLK
jgi:hypothetical protein